jgi:hypothetical protein
MTTRKNIWEVEGSSHRLARIDEAPIGFNYEGGRFATLVTVKCARGTRNVVNVPVLSSQHILHECTFVSRDSRACHIEETVMTATIRTVFQPLGDSHEVPAAKRPRSDSK